MRFSIIVPVYNTAPYLTRCIAALLDQDYPRDQYEILMVNNGSTDASAAILEGAQGIKVLNEPRRGSYCARNRALQEAHGEILAFTDSDSYPCAAWLQAIDRALADPGVHIVMGPRRPARDRGLLRLIADYEVKKVEMVLGCEDPLLYYGYTGNMAVRRAAMERHGPFVERPRGADTIFVRKVVEAEGCRAVQFETGMLVTHGEMASLSKYLEKMFTYGRSRRQYQNLVSTRPLTLRERSRAYMAAVRVRGYSLPGALALGAVLGLGLAAWALGSLSHSFSKRPWR